MKRQLLYVMEDNKMVAEMIRFNLAESYEVKVFHQVETLMQNISSEVDLVLVDFNLNNTINGADLCKWIKNKFDIPIVAISSQNKISVALDFVKNGVIDYIDKANQNFLSQLKISLSAIFIEQRISKRKKDIIKLKKNLVKYSIILVGLSIVFFLI